ncbi:MAG: ATP-binding cassette domain-containing protein, partial [Clostridiaceae bacterium]|nr:ATP-binding cassette domain-containing protein [Clostridiaceae bacterium]
MLKVRDLHVYYGGIHALRGVNINVKEGEIVTIIGSNGAGKSTLLNALSGVVPYKEGSIEYQGEGLPKQADRIVKKGLSQVPEGREIFANLTVR